METKYSAQIDRLVKDGLSKGSCVLFFGPELVKFDGKDFNLAFYETLPDDEFENVNKKTAKYDCKEKIWTFKSIETKRDFYYQFDEFIKQNRDINKPIIHKLASIPFPLIVSLLPDDTINAAFSQYNNFKFSFKSLLDTDVPEPSLEHMLIYNIYGTVENQEYVASHFDFLNFIVNQGQSKGLPTNFTTAIMKANYLVFVGFEFDKWYNIMLLYILNKIKQGQKKYAIEEQSAEELYKRLSDSSLNMMFIESNSEQFINEIYKKAKEQGILRELIPTRDYLANMIKSNEKAIQRSLDRIQLVDPKEELKLKMDIEDLENENKELIKQLINLAK
jgi:hypothetical protein